MTRATRATINLTALRHNLSIAKQAAPHSKQLAVIKANAYGHGIVQVAKALEQADALAVACIDEAVQLRDAGISQSIVVLEGFLIQQELDVCLAYQLTPVIHQLEQIELLEAARSEPIPVWFKVDTGMHRLGFAIEQATQMWRRLHDCRSVDVQHIVLMSHFANADNISDDRTERQYASFQHLCKQISADTATPQCSLANSGGLLGWMHTQMDWIRPGIMLYGISPFKNKTGEAHDLQPVMTLRSQLIAINYCKQGEGVGYGGDWVCPEDMPIGVVAIGYGDGYPRQAKSGTPVLVNGQRTTLVGRVSMDMMTVDLRGLHEIQLGDEVVLWGEGLPAEEVAAHADTIAYDLLCGVNPRVAVNY